MQRPTPRNLPVALAPGDLVAVVAPAGRVDREDLETGVEGLRARGLRVRIGPHVLDAYGHLAGGDRDRASDLMAAFLDPEVQAVWCARGGAGSARTLPYLDLARVAAHPKVFIGYSDVTVLHLALARRVGWPTFYGPMVAADPACWRDDACFEVLWRLVSRAAPAGVLGSPTPVRSRPLVTGTAEGVLAGGTLCLVESSIGTGYAIETRGRLLALEGMEEPPWRVDRMLTHLAHAGLLERASGFVVGSLSAFEGDGGAHELSIEQSLLDHLGPLGKPAFCGFPFGHVASPLTLPLNCRARLDAGAGTLEVLKPAVTERRSP